MYINTLKQLVKLVLKIDKKNKCLILASIDTSIIVSNVAKNMHTSP
jgi:hypothetical protein